MQSSQKISLGGTLAALGVVYGDIGTSPLYAFKESFHHSHGLLVNAPNIYGILSLIFWALIIVVSIKYLVFIVRADNQGEGGVLALSTLISSTSIKSKKLLGALTLLGLFGTALLYGDGMITPAISVLSAVEGLEFVAAVPNTYIIPIAVVILIGLFSLQKHGTATVGKIFGPITLLWFFVIGSLGVSQIIRHPEIIYAVNPWYAYSFFKMNSFNGFTVLGSVFLVVTGGEALYSDLGHFGKSPIRHAWFMIVLPALILCYFGQGSLLLADPEAVKNPFYLMAPDWALLPLVILATLSTCIASQALITGVFSLTMQAVQLNFIPRILIQHTSSEEFGQVFVKSVNFLLMIACISLVIIFRTSSNLANAYGIAVTTTMVITTVLFYFVMHFKWKWSPLIALPLCLFFLAIEGAFWGANLLKVVHGGWFPLLIGVILFTLMTTWHKGRKILAKRMREMTSPLDKFIKEIEKKKAIRVPGTAVYMSGNQGTVPPALYQSFHHFNCLHEHIIFLSVRVGQTPNVSKDERVKISLIDHSFYVVALNYGFMDLPNVPEDLLGLKLNESVELSPYEATYFLGRERIIASKHKGMMRWRERLFSFMSRNAQPATDFFQLPKKRVIEIGSEVDI